ncbi:hypothetical protein FIBSPDRAFT_875668 [Athelia psychrophila]|uniref:MOSC domain-containing protein n=1 Tax=Athelia psychrophila TaxID=1759441 RepID=A0A167XJ50_9AGAM|nr:hypothetical protein FIBSPDRAFT_875668 [Fibularhizoctonia sp. CBS 109695]
MSFASSLSSFLPASITSAFASAPSHTQSLTKDICIKRLRIHPIKSCRGFDLDSVDYDQSGFKYDRTWLVIDAITRNFYTGRELPKMVLIEPKIDETTGTLNISIPVKEKGEAPLVISTPLNPTPAELADYELVTNITIWESKVDGYAVSKEADVALSLYFGKPVRLVRKGPLRRESGPHPTSGPTRYAKDEASVNMQDFYPLLVTSEASFDHVRSTILKSVFPEHASSIDAGVQAYKVPGNLDRKFWTPEYVAGLQIDRFRPNIVLGDAPAATSKMTAFEEDGWESFEIIDQSLAGAAASMFGKAAIGMGQGIYTLVRCARCMVPNIDPATGVRDAHLPYRITIQSRQVDPTIAKPCFGMLSCSREASGTLRVGDIVRVTSTADPDAPNRTLMSAFPTETSGESK